MLKLVLLLLFVSGSLSQDACPKHCKCSSTATLQSLARCRILDSKAQRFPSDITHLVVTNTPEGYSPQLTKDIFIELGLEKVKHIKIHNTTLQEIHREAFNGLESLESVDLSSNNIYNIFRDTFVHNKRLQKLRLSRNPIQSIIFPENPYFLDISSLKEIDLSYCQLTSIPAESFIRLESLESINLSHNNINFLDEFTFSQQGSLLEINLAYNDLSFIFPSVFSELELQTLNLRGNKITSPAGLDSVDLEELDLSENMINNLTRGVFENLTNLINLNLSGNQIRKISKEAFSGLSDLKYLYLGSNNIEELPRGLFDKTESLELLTLSNNPLKSFNRSKTECTRLRRLEIFNCGLTNLAESFTGLNQLTYLNVSHNFLRVVKASDFKGLEDLHYLDLSWNEIDHLPLNLFQDSPKMSKVILANNNIRHLSPLIFEPTPLLFALDMSYNKMPYIWNNTEIDTIVSKNLLPNLVMMDLAYNQLTQLHAPVLKSLPKLGTLDVTGNPFVCDETFQHAMNYLFKNKIQSGAREIPGMPVALGSDEDEPGQHWSQLVRVVCQEDDVLEINDDSVKEESEEDDDEDDDDVDDEHPRLFLNRINVPIITEEDLFDWPTLGIAFLGILVIIGLINWGIYVVCRAKRNNRMVPYKSHFPNPLGGLSQIRHGSSSHIYHKLYEDCSVPNSPIVKGPGKSVIATIVHSVRPESV